MNHVYAPTNASAADIRTESAAQLRARIDLWRTNNNLGQMALQYIERLILAHAEASRVDAGHAPYGYRRRGGELVRHPGEQHGIERMKALREAGYSFQQIANILQR